jgi:hypothetical protein
LPHAPGVTEPEQWPASIMVEEYIMESLSFDPMAELHDETRASDGDFLDTALIFLPNVFLPSMAGFLIKKE